MVQGVQCETDAEGMGQDGGAGWRGAAGGAAPMKAPPAHTQADHSSVPVLGVHEMGGVRSTGAVLLCAGVGLGPPGRRAGPAAAGGGCAPRTGYRHASPHRRHGDHHRLARLEPQAAGKEGARNHADVCRVNLLQAHSGWGHRGAHVRRGRQAGCGARTQTEPHPSRCPARATHLELRLAGDVAGVGLERLGGRGAALAACRAPRCASAGGAAV